MSEAAYSNAGAGTVSPTEKDNQSGEPDAVGTNKDQEDVTETTPSEQNDGEGVGSGEAVVGPGSRDIGSFAPGSTVMSPPNAAFIPDALDKVTKEVEDDTGEPQLVEKDFTIKTHLDERRQLDPHGVYLDDVQRQQAEIERARREGREPNLETPPPYAGDQVVLTEAAKADVGIYAANYPVSFSQPVSVGQPENADDFADDENRKSYLTSDANDSEDVASDKTPENSPLDSNKEPVVI